jgi:4-amino-4-deoxy-L-arabinose transferase-like glycosyltransferase
MQPIKNKLDSDFIPIGIVISVLLLIAVWRINIAIELPLSVDEAYYVAWSKSLDWGYWTKPPLIAWGIAGARSLCGETVICIRSTSLIAYPMTSLLLLLLAWRMGESLKSACALAILFATIPLTTFYGIAATTDAFLILMWTLSLLFLWLALEGKNWAWVLLGIAVGFGMLAKYTMVVFVVSAILILLHPHWRKHWKSSGPYLSAFTAFITFSPNVIWNIKHDMPTFQHTADISHGSNHYGLHWESLGKFLLEQLVIGNPILVIAFLFFAFRILRTTIPLKSWFGLAACLPILLVICGQALLARAHANWAATAYIGISILSVSYLWANHKLMIALACCINLVFSSVLYHYQSLIAEPFHLKGTISADPYWALRNWPGITDQI